MQPQKHRTQEKNGRHQEQYSVVIHIRIDFSHECRISIHLRTDNNREYCITTHHKICSRSMRYFQSINHQRSSQYVENGILSEGNVIQQNYHREFVREEGEGRGGEGGVRREKGSEGEGREGEGNKKGMGEEGRVKEEGSAPPPAPCFSMAYLEGQAFSTAWALEDPPRHLELVMYQLPFSREAACGSGPGPSHHHHLARKTCWDQE